MQVHLTQARLRRLTRWSRRLVISLAEAVLRRVDAQLGRNGMLPPCDVHAALAVCGKYRDPGGRTRVAREHDRYLDEAYRT